MHGFEVELLQALLGTVGARVEHAGHVEQQMDPLGRGPDAPGQRRQAAGVGDVEGDYGNVLLSQPVSGARISRGPDDPVAPLSQGRGQRQAQPTICPHHHRR